MITNQNEVDDIWKRLKKSHSQKKIGRSLILTQRNIKDNIVPSIDKSKEKALNKLSSQY